MKWGLDFHKGRGINCSTNGECRKKGKGERESDIYF